MRKFGAGHGEGEMRTQASPDIVVVPKATLFSRAWKWWEKVGSVLAILGLADVFGQFVKWASGFTGS